ncbi:Putative amino-acid ABC transporter-binding protein YhdW [Seminavis robusta]|uniref:Amino-acid ABC transporter-binding protein YhdW n=1 Tax=Seminavis robusta TaxID=568900 RepID=A0A9N8E300_9STRA|nr:Putative amino-acid ABC transporter-binding protein YhdW [Seminavis robusta]|eukprot:Sro474_g150260.1 Putative amino-acid ABC transporter-binding protein YhdW (1203) ;mRNA; r:41362-45472
MEEHRNAEKVDKSLLATHLESPSRLSRELPSADEPLAKGRETEKETSRKSPALEGTYSTDDTAASLSLSSHGSSLPMDVVEVDVDEEIARQQEQQSMEKEEQDITQSATARSSRQRESLVIDVDSLALSRNTDDEKKSSTAMSEKERLLHQQMLPESSVEIDKLAEAMRLLDSFGANRLPVRRVASQEEGARRRPKGQRRWQSCTEEMILGNPLQSHRLEEDSTKRIDDANEETKMEETEPRPPEQAPDSNSFASGEQNSYAARVARKQQRLEASSSATTLENSPRASSPGTRRTTENTGKRAFFGDIHGEIAEAQARAQESRRNLKSSQMAQQPTMAQQQPRPPLARNAWNSKHSVATEGSAVSSMDDTSVYSVTTESGSNTHHQSATTATTTTPNQQEANAQLSLSQHASRRRMTRGGSQASLPGAYPATGRAPFANPRFRGGAVTLFGENITASSNHESSTGMGDMSQSYYGLGLSNSCGRQQQRRRWDESTGESSEAHNNSRSLMMSEAHYSRSLHTDASFRTNESSEINPERNLEASANDDGDNPGEIVAVCVEEDDLEQNIREEIIQSAAQAEVVEQTEMAELTSKKKELQQLKYVTCFLLFFVVISVAVGLGVGYMAKASEAERKESSVASDDVVFMEPSASPTMTPIPTLEKVYASGVLRCGIYETTGFDEESGERFGVDVDWCRAIAAAIMGRDSYEIVLIDATFADRFELVANRTVDVLTASSTFTMDRNVYEVGVETGLTFSPPFMYDGLRFAGPEGPVACMDNDMENFGPNCRDIKVCVVGGSSYHAILAYRLPKRQIHVVDGWQSMYGGLRDGLCNVIAAEGVSLGVQNVRAFGYNYSYVTGRSLFSKIPLSMVTRDDDPTFSNFVHSVLHSVFVAEQVGITQETSHLVPDTFISGSELFGDRFANMFEDAIAIIGNYGELYDRHAASAVAREGLTLLNNGSTGLLFAFPFGLVGNDGPGPVSGGTIERILESGVLRCAVVGGRPGFAEMAETVSETANTNLTITGLDVDFCRALATSLFSGSVDLVELIEVRSEAEGYKVLSEGYADVFAGAHWTLQNDVREPSTGVGYSFSQPYFYGEGEENLSLATREDDGQWSKFCFWIVASTFYAEENGIDQRLSNSMPSVYLFGPQFLRMLRDPILELGNYGELYERNVGPHIPRGGRNVINSIRTPGPQFYPVPGLLRDLSP